jgi:preprotein translocase subunit SecG
MSTFIYMVRIIIIIIIIIILDSEESDRLHVHISSKICLVFFHRCFVRPMSRRTFGQ